MDQLVEQLGYLDYRDALAANKYILQTKRAGDYHQAARAKALSLAFARMSRLKREQIEKQAAQEAQADAQASKKKSKKKEGAEDDRQGGESMAEARAQKKLDLLMDQDATVAQLYQEAYKDAKAEGEREMDELKALHGRFDHYLDPTRMAGTLPTRWYDPKALDDSENIQYSTDFTDLEEDLMYKRYKMLQYGAREDLKAYEARIDAIMTEQEAAEPVLEEVKRDKEGQVEAPMARRLTTMLYDARAQTFEAQARDDFLENQIAALKRGKALRQKEETREKAMYKADPIFGDFMPDWSKDAENSRARSLALHPEIRKMESSTLPERPDASVYDEQSAREYEDFHQMTVGYYKGKLRFFEDCFNNQLALTTHGFQNMRE